MFPNRLADGSYVISPEEDRETDIDNTAAIKEMGICQKLCADYARISCIGPMFSSYKEYYTQAIQYNSMLADIAEENGYLLVADYHRHWANIWKVALEKQLAREGNLSTTQRKPLEKS